MLKMDRVVNGLAAQLFLGPAEHRRGRRVHEHQVALAIRDVQALGQVLHNHRAELVGLLALGDVDDHDADPRELPLHAHRVVARQKHTGPLRGHISLDRDLLVEHRLAGFQDLPVHGRGLRPRGRHHLGDGAVELVLQRGAMDHSELFVHATDAKVAVHEAKAHRRG